MNEIKSSQLNKRKSVNEFNTVSNTDINIERKNSLKLKKNETNLNSNKPQDNNSGNINVKIFKL